MISDAGFFADGKWHGMAEAMRSEQGESLVGGLDRDGFGAMLNAGAQRVRRRRRSTRTGRRSPTTAAVSGRRSSSIARWTSRSSKPWQGKLAELGVPTLLLWGAEDPFAPLAGARRFEREIPGAHLVAIEGAGHFVIDEQPERCIAEITGFLT